MINAKDSSEVDADANTLPVLDKGFVRLVDFMGGDLAVVQGARVSFGQETKGDERDRKLVMYLMKHQHGTPFEMAVFKFHIKAPIFVARQWFRHRIGSYNEISYRYVEVKDEFYVPMQMRTQDTKNKQASFVGNFTQEQNQVALGLMAIAYEEAYEKYQQLLTMGVARELARIILPVAMYTQFYVTYNARSLMNFIQLRSGEGAQYEIKLYAETLSRIFKDKMPWTFAAFEEFVLKRSG
jgi:thymidylate synthase (FAD)